MTLLQQGERESLNQRPASRSPRRLSAKQRWLDRTNEKATHTGISRRRRLVIVCLCGQVPPRTALLSHLPCTACVPKGGGDVGSVLHSSGNLISLPDRGSSVDLGLPPISPTQAACDQEVRLRKGKVCLLNTANCCSPCQHMTGNALHETKASTWHQRRYWWMTASSRSVPEESDGNLTFYSSLCGLCSGCTWGAASAEHPQTK